MNCIGPDCIAPIPANVPKEHRELWYLANIAERRSKGREIITLGWFPKFNLVLKKYFSRDVTFGVSHVPEHVDHENVFPSAKIEGKHRQYYLVSLYPWSEEIADALKRLGYAENEDVAFRIPRPVVLTNYDLGWGSYRDERGNTIEGDCGKIGKIAFYGEDNHIVLHGENYGTENLEITFEMSATAEIGGCSENSASSKPGGILFLDKFKIESVDGVPGNAMLTIENNCQFYGDARIRFGISPHSSEPYTSLISIGEFCRFERGFYMACNGGKKIVIGRNSMCSHNVSLQAGDWHSIFDVETGKNINSIYDNLSPRENRLILGEHVWVGFGATILQGSDIGSGSIVGAGSVVKGVYPNNCTIYGNPARIGRKNIAWCWENMAKDPSLCGEKYFKKTVTNDEKSP